MSEARAKYERAAALGEIASEREGLTLKPTSLPPMAAVAQAVPTRTSLRS
jgi:hypothetical protein